MATDRLRAGLSYCALNKLIPLSLSILFLSVIAALICAFVIALRFTHSWVLEELVFPLSRLAFSGKQGLDFGNATAATMAPH